MCKRIRLRELSRTAARDSGWAKLRAALSRFFVVSPQNIRPRDEGLVRELLAQVQTLLSKLEAGEGADAPGAVGDCPFIPFTEDAQPRIRGKCPLELAGYDISSLPMAQVCRGWALAWTPHLAKKELVPNA